jgi:chaperone modulatory protein CbpM
MNELLNAKVTLSVWLDQSAVCSIDQLAEVSGLTVDEIEDLVDNGLIEPADAPERAFHLLHVVTVRKARRLRDDFQLDRNGLALAMTLLRRIDKLEAALLAERLRLATPS